MEAKYISVATDTIYWNTRLLQPFPNRVSIVWMIPHRKPIRYVNAACQKAMQKLPEAVKIDFLNDLNFVAAGREPRSPFKHLPELGAGVVELIENGSPAYRAVYCAKFIDTVFVLHAFTKTTNGVDRKAMNTVRERYKEMMQIVRAERG